MGYYNKLTKAMDGKAEFSNKTLEDIIKDEEGTFKPFNTFNNATQIWNHSFYWNCLQTPKFEKGEIKSNRPKPGSFMDKAFIKNFKTFD